MIDPKKVEVRLVYSREEIAFRASRLEWDTWVAIKNEVPGLLVEFYSTADEIISWLSDVLTELDES